MNSIKTVLGLSRQPAVIASVLTSICWLSAFSAEAQVSADLTKEVIIQHGEDGRILGVRHVFQGSQSPTFRERDLELVASLEGLQSLELIAPRPRLSKPTPLEFPSEKRRTTATLFSPLKRRSTSAKIQMMPQMGNLIDDSWLHHLRSLVDLQVLDLSYQPITALGLLHIEGLTELKQLRLRGTKISGAAIDTLIRLPHLEHLDLRETRLSRSDIKRLRFLLKADCDLLTDY